SSEGKEPCRPRLSTSPCRFDKDETTPERLRPRPMPWRAPVLRPQLSNTPNNKKDHIASYDSSQRDRRLASPERAKGNRWPVVVRRPGAAINRSCVQGRKQAERRKRPRTQ